MAKKFDPRLGEQTAEEFEQAGRDDRHGLINTRAAAQLLMGAYGVGEITDEQYKTAVEEFVRLNPRAKFDLNAHFARVKKKRDEFRRSKQKSKSLARELPVGQQVLIVDDEVDSAGWRVLFDCVLGGRVLYGAQCRRGGELGGQGERTYRSCAP